MAEQAESAPISAVSVKIPAPRPNDLEVWLHAVDAQFATKAIISESTKFDYLLTAMTLEVHQVSAHYLTLAL